MDFKYFILLFIVRKKYQTAKMLRAELINYPFFEHKNREIVDIL